MHIKAIGMRWKEPFQLLLEKWTDLKFPLECVSTKGRGCWGVWSLSFTPPSEPGQGTKPGQNHWLRLLPRVILLTQVLWATEGMPGQLLGAAVVPSGWALTPAGLWGDGSISAGANPWAPHPGWTQPHFFLPWWWWCDGAGRQGVWAGGPPLVTHRVPALQLGLAANFSDWK